MLARKTAKAGRPAAKPTGSTSADYSGDGPGPALVRAPLWLLRHRRQELRRQPDSRLGAAQSAAGSTPSRLKLAHRLAWSRRRRLAAAVPEEWRERFDRDGYVELRDFLPTDVFGRLQQALLTKRFETRQHQQGNTITRRVAVGPALLRRVPELRGDARKARG